MVRISTFFKVMALIAIMFGVSFNAEAQLLGGIAKAIKNKSQQSKQEKAMETPTGDAKDAKNGPATFSVGRDGEYKLVHGIPKHSRLQCSAILRATRKAM